MIERILKTITFATSCQLLHGLPFSTLGISAESIA